MNMESDYILKRNVGIVGRPHLACAVCGFTPTGHVLSARTRLDVEIQPDKGLCNVHAHGLKENEIVTSEQLARMRQEWLESR